MSQFATPYPSQTPMNADSIFVPVDYVAITPSDTVNFTASLGTCRGIYVGVGGTIVAITAKGTVATFLNAAPGTIIPGYFTRVNSTSTTATDLLAVY